jgi:membrane fusion protein (multidrug efflux system)
MKRICLSSAILTFAAAMLLTGCGKKEEAAPRPLPPVPPPTLPVVQVAKAVEEEKEARGFQAIALLEGSTNTEIHARVAGYLIRQDYQEGAVVKAGDLLFLIDPKLSQADLAKLQGNINSGYTRITSPVNGVAGKAVPGLGDWIGPGTPLTTISTVKPIKAVFALPKKFYLDHSDRIAQVLALAPEARPETLELVLADGTPYSHKGRWDSIERPAPASTGPVTACALFPNPDRVLRPGQYVKVGEGNP